MIEIDDGMYFWVLICYEEEGFYFYEVESEIEWEVKIFCESQVQGSSCMLEFLKCLLQGYFEYYKNFSM